jgi:hypothetical protein
VALCIRHALLLVAPVGQRVDDVPHVPLLVSPSDGRRHEFSVRGSRGGAQIWGDFYHLSNSYEQGVNAVLGCK